MKLALAILTTANAIRVREDYAEEELKHTNTSYGEEYLFGEEQVFYEEI